MQDPDDRLLEELSEIVERDDPVPDAVREAGYAVFTKTRVSGQHDAPSVGQESTARKEQDT